MRLYVLIPPPSPTHALYARTPRTGNALLGGDGLHHPAGRHVGDLDAHWIVDRVGSAGSTDTLAEASRELAADFGGHALHGEVLHQDTAGARPGPLEADHAW